MLGSDTVECYEFPSHTNASLFCDALLALGAHHTMRWDGCVEVVWQKDIEDTIEEAASDLGGVLV